jgi:hypothetical protein
MSNNVRVEEEKSKNDVIGGILKNLKETQNISAADVINYIRQNKDKTEKIPVSIFRLGLSPLQASVKFLAENKGYTFSEVARQLNRDQRTIWNTYHAANLLKSDSLRHEETKYFVEISVFRNRELSFLENLCVYLRKNYSLTYHKIAMLIGKDDRTIWTVCKRADNKINRKDAKNE